jgi:hypothetical protein
MGMSFAGLFLFVVSFLPVLREADILLLWYFLLLCSSNTPP